jgi:hypothetical protein
MPHGPTAATEKWSLMTDPTGGALLDLYSRGYKVRGVGIPWFAAHSWALLLAVAADRVSLPDTFEEFERHAGARFDALVTDGHPLEKVLIDVERLVAWCGELGRPIDAHARAAFAAITLAHQCSHAGNA